MHTKKVTFEDLAKDINNTTSNDDVSDGDYEYEIDEEEEIGRLALIDRNKLDAE